MPKGCSKCGTENADGTKFCRACGTGLGPAAPDTLSAAYDVSCHACGALNPAGARFCAKCGADQTPITVPGTLPAALAPSAASAPSVFPKTPPRPASARTPAWASTATAPPPVRPKGLWIGLGVIAFALAAGGVWWFKSSHGTVASLDEPAPASVPAAAPTATPPPVTPTVAPPAAPAPAPAPASEPPAGTSTTAAEPPTTTPASAGGPMEPAAKGTAPAVAATPPDAASAAALAKEKDKAARDARAKALRERREQAASQAAASRAAEQEAARRRADEARSRAAPAAPPPSVQSSAPATVPVAPVHARTAQEICAGRNLIMQGICEARECMKNEHSDEPLCQRVRADDDRRRQ